MWIELELNQENDTSMRTSGCVEYLFKKSGFPGPEFFAELQPSLEASAPNDLSYEAMTKSQMYEPSHRARDAHPKNMKEVQKNMRWKLSFSM